MGGFRLVPGGRMPERGESGARPPFGYQADGDGPALCRRFCSRLEVGGRPLPKGSPAGIALCRLFCRGFARGVAVTVVRRPRGTQGAH